jgi:hypothetical protein
MYSRLAGYVFQRVQITTGKNYDRKKNVPAVSWKLEKITSGKKGTVVSSCWLEAKHKTQHTS